MTKLFHLNAIDKLLVIEFSLAFWISVVPSKLTVLRRLASSVHGNSTFVAASSPCSHAIDWPRVVHRVVVKTRVRDGVGINAGVRDESTEHIDLV